MWDASPVVRSIRGLAGDLEFAEIWALCRPWMLVLVLQLTRHSNERGGAAWERL